jgi:hypothetical protein
MKRQKITDDIKKEVEKIVEAFNKEHKSKFQVQYKGRFLYLEKVTTRYFRTTTSKVGRLEYNGDMENWSFAVFKYSSETYDPDEFFFPGGDKLDGTIEGALRAGLEIY